MSELPLTTGYGPLFLNSVLIPLTLPELKIMWHQSWSSTAFPICLPSLCQRLEQKVSHAFV